MSKRKGFRLKARELRKKGLPELRELLVVVRNEVRTQKQMLTNNVVAMKEDPNPALYKMNRRNIATLLLVITEKEASQS